MISRIEAIKILNEWFDYAKKTENRKRLKQIWLLLDYAEGDVWSKDFYNNHQEDVRQILELFDNTKSEIKQIAQWFKQTIF